ncbi:hypothetical protein G5V59_04610 [Nocardioides sp. W3-2-3]|uniref:hypothetical protein n=1 Tax=Nocardioides convexus TaxID=2712224 RepID=UPI002418B0B9|nr:hypothetical protein [Nocardioides convexus]NGZ99835.1 hypothetical protein [Nocardioides convexus]
MDDRVLVPCTEMLGPLLVAGNPLLSGLLASKHLTVLDGIRPARRKDLALTLLRWLESASATNQPGPRHGRAAADPAQPPVQSSGSSSAPRPGGPAGAAGADRGAARRPAHLGCRGLSTRWPPSGAARGPSTSPRRGQRVIFRE